MGSNLLKGLKRWWLWLDDDKVTGGNSAHTSLSPPTSSALQGGHARNTSPTVGGAQEASLHVEEYHAIRRFCRASALCGSGGGHRWSDPTADTVVTGTWNIKRRVQSPKSRTAVKENEKYLFSLQHYWLADTGKVNKVREEVKGQIGIIL